jgi:hypothetical protein
MKVRLEVNKKPFTLQNVTEGMSNRDAQIAHMELLNLEHEMEIAYPNPDERTLQWDVILAAMEGRSINLSQAAVEYADAKAMDTDSGLFAQALKNSPSTRTHKNTAQTKGRDPLTRYKSTTKTPLKDLLNEADDALD